MKNNWQKMTIGEFSPFTYGQSLPERIRFNNGPYLVYGSNGAVGNHDRALINEAGVIIGRKGSVGEIHFSKQPFWPIDTTFFITAGENRDIRFAYYLLKSLGLEKMNSDSAVPGLNREAAHNRIVYIPPLPEQRAIAEVLSALDDKIELNRKINRTLEQLAQAVYKHMFIDNPERDEWEEGNLEDLLMLQRGFDLPTNKRVPGNYPVIAASGPSGTHNEFKVKGPGVTTGRSGVIGNVYYTFDDYWPLNTSLWVKDFKIATPAFAYYLLLTVDFPVFSAGSAVPTLNRNHIHTLTMKIPPKQLIEKFELIAKELLQLQKHNEKENQTLAELRDTLLPKLMLGQIKVI